MSALKRKSVVVIITLLVTLSAGNAAYAKIKQKQPHTPFPDPYQEYIFDVNDFYSDQQAFNSAVSQYRAYQTAQSKEDALDYAKVMLESGRVALKQYLLLLSTNLSQQEDFNPRVKQAILQDLSAHNTYLDTAAQSLSQAQTISQVEDLGKAMDLRISYIKSTGTQALGYIDAVTMKKRIDESRIIANKFNSIIAGYPPENRSRGIVEKWVQETIPDLANSENKLAQFVDSIYPPPTSGNNKPFYEDFKTIANISLLQEVTIKQRNYASKFKEINQIARSAYQEL